MTAALLTIPETADRLRCSRAHVYRLIAKGDLKTKNIGTGRYSKTRVRESSLAAYIDGHASRTVPLRLVRSA